MFNFFIFFLSLFLLGGCGSSSTSTDDNTANEAVPIVDVPSKLPMLVVLVSYKDIDIKYSPQEWSDEIFGIGDYQLNNYYEQVSENKFSFVPVKESDGTENDGIIKVTLDKNHPDLSVDDPNFISLVYPDFKEVLEALDSKIDFSQYDTDHNHALSNKELIVTFIIAGYEDAYEGYHVKDGIWGHQNCMVSDNEIAILDGTTLLSCADDATFALFGEQHDKDRPHQATIGIIAHELAHATFNLPDLYNTADVSKGGIGIFGIMGAGTWTRSNNQQYAGTSPTHFCAWSKIHNGWIEPLVLHDKTATLYQTASLNYNVVKIPIDDTSYYLLENRNNKGYDEGLRELSGVFDGGIAIWKIDETKLTQDNFLKNDVNADTQHKGVDLVEASASTIDSSASNGDEDALYYEGNKDYFLDLVDGISPRGEEMHLNLLN